MINIKPIQSSQEVINQPEPVRPAIFCGTRITRMEEWPLGPLRLCRNDRRSEQSCGPSLGAIPVMVVPCASHPVEGRRESCGYRRSGPGGLVHQLNGHFRATGANSLALRGDPAELGVS